jgi:hypothetical protein
LFRRYWQAKTTDIFIGETIPLPNYKNVLVQGPWGQRMLAGLDEVTTDYTVFILEDYYLEEIITDQFLNDHVAILEEHGADKIMFDILCPYGAYSLTSLGSDLYSFNNHSQYLNSIQPSIWRTDYLRKVLKPNMSPWEFEIDGNPYAQSLNPRILLKARLEKIYFNFCRRGGVFSEGWQEFLVKENLC